MFINWKKREIDLNIVYYGPALSGKTTNLEQIHARMKPDRRSDLFTLNTHEDRTIFFDFMRIELGNIGGLQPRFGLYTVPGQVYYESTRETVLRRADALVFVADSQVDRLEDNVASWEDMQRHLARMRKFIRTMPTIVQFNKRDLPNISPVAELKQALELGRLPTYEAVAIQGVGVAETMQATMKYLLAYVQHQLKKRSKST